jgi:hypothetical protein
LVLLGENIGGEGLMQGVAPKNRKRKTEPVGSVFLFKLAAMADVSYLEGENTLL